MPQPRPWKMNGHPARHQYKCINTNSTWQPAGFSWREVTYLVLHHGSWYALRVPLPRAEAREEDVMQARRILACLVSAMLFTAPSVGRAHAQLGVTCYKVKDPAAKATYTAGRVAGITTRTGCTINVPAVMACIPGGPSGLTPTPPGSPGPSPTSPVACYKVKCSKQQLQVLPFADEF